MSERIQELSEQAKKSVPQGILTPDKWVVEYNKIFAELLEKDCEAKHFSAGYIAGRSDGIMETVQECIQIARGADGLDATHEAWYLIQQRFGVK